MKNPIKLFSFFLIVSTLLNTACRKEEFLSVGAQPDQGISAGSNVARLLASTAMKDGSIDNIIDQANCFTVELPVNLIVNGTEITIQNADEYETIEALFEESDEDEDSLEIVFPISIELSDHTTIAISDANQLESIRNDCAGENEEDEDIECVDLQYPIEVSIFNSNTELFDSVSLENDEELFDFIEALNENDVVNIEFPIILVLTDGVEMEINDLTELENTIEALKDSCDEDDDYDFDDDDCDECTVEQLEQVLIGCADWRVNKFALDGENIKSQYDTLSFIFQEDGNMAAASDTETFFGTWSANGIGNDISVVIDIPGLDVFNLMWNLVEVLETPGINKVTLRVDNDNILRFQDACNGGDGNGNSILDPDTVLSDGTWSVGSYFNGAIDNTSNFNGYDLLFNIDGSLIADNGTQINGTWNVENGDKRLTFDFGSSQPFNQLSTTWRITQISDTSIELTEIGAGDGSLILQKQ